MVDLRFKIDGEWKQEILEGGPLLSQLFHARNQIDGRLGISARYPGAIELQYPVLDVDSYESRLLHLFENPGTWFVLRFDDEIKWRKWYVDREDHSTGEMFGITQRRAKRQIKCRFMPWGTGDDRCGFVVTADDLAELRD